MAFIGQSIHTETVEYNSGARDPFPAGVYSAVVTRAEQKPTKDQSGIRLEVEFDLQAPEAYRGRKFWDSFNIMNRSAEAQRIAMEQLGQLAKASGIPVLEDDQQLLNREVQIEMTLGKDKDGTPRNRARYFPAGVDVKAFKEQVKGSGAAAAPQPATAPAATAPAWRRPVA